MATIPWHRVEHLRGSCLCGAIAYEINGDISPIGQCHCSRCRKATGTAAAMTFWAKAEGFRFTAGESLVRSYSKPSGYTLAFCERCASPMPHLAEGGDYYYVLAGTLDDDPGLRGTAVHIFVGSKAPWDEITGDSPQFEGSLEL